MATGFVNIDRDTPRLLPPDLRDWVPASPLAHFILAAVEALDRREVKVLELAQELKLAQFGPITVSLDGTKIAANASKHSAVSDERAGQMLEQLELEVQQLLAKAEQADATPRPEGRTIPAELVRRQERKAALEKARAGIEARAPARYAAAVAAHAEPMAARLARQQRGEKLRGPASRTNRGRHADGHRGLRAAR